MAHMIEIDDELLEYLKEEAEPFVDTPNSVLRRLLALDGPQTSRTPPEVNVVAGATMATRGKRAGSRSKRRPSSGGRKRVPAGSILPEGEYEVPLLRTLVDAGGSGSSRTITAAVGEHLNAKLTELDREPLKSGGIRWQNRIQFVRLRMIERGYIEKDSPRGTWEITDEGRKFLEAVQHEGR